MTVLPDDAGATLLELKFSSTNSNSPVPKAPKDGTIHPSLGTFTRP
jgi:hypothetical protein